MRTNTKNSQENKNRAVANGIARPIQTIAAAGPITDNRPATIAQRKLQQSIATTAKPIIQRAISNSAMYPPNGVTAPMVTALDNLLPTAEARARRRLLNPTNGVHTPHQANYLRNSSPTTWGYCVEEQLNPVASANGWTTQIILNGARPDYERDVHPNIELYVDLTTVAQAGVGGNHVTAKLNRTIRPHGVVWHAADITHTGPPGGQAPVLRTNGKVTNLQMSRFQAYKRYLSKPGGGYKPKKDDFRRRYGAISHPTFTQIWSADQRKRFATAAKAAGF